MEFSIATIVFITLTAGFLGTIVMTLGQVFEMRITGRSISFSPAIGFSKVFGINFDVLTERNKTTLNYIAHFLYGTVWAIPFTLLLLAGFTNYLSMLLMYFIVVWAQGMVVLPLFGATPPPWKWGIKSLSKDGMHHFIYALTTSVLLIKIAELTLAPIT
ncbi:MAG TPA: hypothetical protein ENI66_01490 [Candidatus Yonathbacteria bacterium]|nr:hypothetical protein [Candidatus Yonathbacteria bacterium]